MRLRLTVQRNGLPDTSILWPVPEYPSPTIADLLESINESVPVQAGDWGFEDYAVELKGAVGKGYECLHYQRVADVFKEDDEVVVRPLLTFDVKNRKRSGRHQISSEGYKLYDGLAYGKTITRALANRPDIKIPPRKRRKVAYAAEEDDVDEEDIAGLICGEEESEQSLLPDPSTQLILHKSLEDEDEEDEDDDDFDPDAEDEDDEVSSQSLTDSEESQSSQKCNASEVRDNNDGAIPSASIPLDGDNDLVTIFEATQQDAIECLQKVFPGASEGVCARVLIGTGDLDLAYDALNVGFIALRTKDAAIGELSGKVNAMAQRKLKASNEEPVTKEVTLPESLLQADAPLISPQTRTRTRDTRQSNFKSDTAHTSQVSEPFTELPLLANVLGSCPNTKDDHEEFDEGESEEESGDEISSLARHYDQNGFPPGSILGGKLITFGTDSIFAPSSRIASPQPEQQADKYVVSSTLVGGLTSTPFIDSEDQQGSLSTSSGEDSSDDSEDADASVGVDSASSSSDDSSSSDSDSSVSENNALALPARIVAVDSEDDSSSDSSSDDEPEVVSSKIVLKEEPIHGPSSIGELTVTKTANHFHGRGATRERNARRSRRQKLDRLLKKGILPRDTTSAEFRKLDVDSSTPPGEAFAALAQLRTSQAALVETTKLLDHPQGSNSQATAEESQAQSQEFAARREELLAALAAGGVDVGYSPPANKTPVPKALPASKPQKSKSAEESRQKADSISSQVEVVDGLSDENVCKTYNLQATLSPPTSKVLETGEVVGSRPSESAESTPRTRKTKWDAGAGRRMVFGHLGIRAPRNKAEEENVRQKLMQSVRPVHPAKQTQMTILEDAPSQELDESDDWMGRINYSAVECVQEGIILSTPPFPFVQRWDPQQKLGGKRKSKQQDDGSEDAHASKKTKQRNANRSYAEEQDYLDELYQPSFPDTLDYDDNSQETMHFGLNMGREIQNLPMEGANVSVSETNVIPEDLAPLPEDIGALPDLVPGGARKGMTIAFKTLVMNERWEPIQSDYRTAIVIEVFDNGDMSLALAKRDRKQKKYDEETGARVYDKFEMPSDDEDDEDDGMLRLCFAELSGAKTLRPAPTDFIEPGADQVSFDIQPESQELNIEDQTQASQVAETQERDLGDVVVVEAESSIALHDKTIVSTQFSDKEALQSPVPSLLEDEIIISQTANIQESQTLPDGQQSHITETTLASDAIPSDDGPHSDSYFESQEHPRSLSAHSPSESANAHAYTDEDDEIYEASQQLAQEADSAQSSKQATPRPQNLQSQESLSRGVPPLQVSRDTTPRLQSPQAAQRLDQGLVSSPSSKQATPQAQFLQPSQQPEQQDVVDTFSTRSTPRPQSLPRSSPSLPSNRDIDVLSAEANDSETRAGITNLIKDAGFRSQVPSSITKGFVHQPPSTPGDSHVFQQLLQEMEPRSDAVYSPKFTDYAHSSPTRAQSATPIPQASTRQLDQSSWMTVDERVSSQTKPAMAPSTAISNQDTSLPSSPPRVSPVSTTPHDEVEDGVVSVDSQGWETDSDSVVFASQPKQATVQETVAPKPRKRVPIGQDWGVWEQLAGKSSKRSASPTNEKKLSSESYASDAEDIQTSPTISYPKLSIESSFTSIIADHGRRPDLGMQGQGDDETTSKTGTEQSTMSLAPATQERVIPEQTPEAQIVADLIRSTVEPSRQSHLHRFVSNSPISARIAALLRTPVKVIAYSPPEKAPSPSAVRAESLEKPYTLGNEPKNALLVSPSPEPVDATTRAVTEKNELTPSISAAVSPQLLPVIAETNGIADKARAYIKYSPDDSQRPLKPWSFNHIGSSVEPDVEETPFDSLNTTNTLDQQYTSAHDPGPQRATPKPVFPIPTDLGPGDELTSFATAEGSGVSVKQRPFPKEPNTDNKPIPEGRSPTPAEIDSDDEFPSIEEVLSLSQRPTKIESLPPISRPKDRKQTMVKQADKSSLNSGSEGSHTFGRKTVSRAAQPAEQSISNSKPSEGRKSASREPFFSALQLSAHKPRNTRPPPPSAPKSTGTLIDLTQSSDVEDESSNRHAPSAPVKISVASNGDESSPEPFESFLSQYSVDSDDGNNTSKPKPSIEEGRVGGHSKKSNGLRDSSQSSLNREKGRKSGSWY